MLQNLNVTHVIIGHSERRALGESDDIVNKKLIAVLKAGLTGVVCVGERERDHAAHYLTGIERQIRHACAKVSKAKLEQVVIAYEPIWAIGTGNNATPDDVHEMKLFIEKVLTDLYGRNEAQKVRILYGGSVIARNAEIIYTQGMVDGFLVGGASLRPSEFCAIVQSVRSV
jgi:triosephosphate isomerase (TIM)